MRFTTPIATMLAGTCLLAASAATAQQQKMQPGLWDHSFTMKSQSGKTESAMAQMQQQMASLPPEQRKMVEQMLARQGVSMGPKGNSVKVCITKEQAELDSIPQREGCTQKVQRVGANTVKVSFSCQGGRGEPPSSGEGTLQFSSPKAYDGTFVVKTVVDGKPDQVEMTQSGKWLAADCGAIKPER
ncbi:MAG TPA: DUF3617 domain-containing protein [Burkholderiaceae bacterium]